MISTALLVSVSAFFLAEEKERGQEGWTHRSLLKTLFTEALHLAWQLGLLALLVTGLQRLEPLAPLTYGKKGFCVAGAWLLAQVRGKTPVYFTVLAALGLGLINAFDLGWKNSLFFTIQALGGILGMQILYLGVKERLLLGRIPAAVENLPLAFLGFFLVLFSVWATGLWF